jgi:hypothetical protein
VLPSREELDREWAQWKKFVGLARSMGRAVGRSMDELAARVLREAGGQRA